MNTDTGELREMTAKEAAALNKEASKVSSTVGSPPAKGPWVPVTKAKVRRLMPLAPSERLEVVKVWEARKERLHQRAIARSKRKVKH